MLRQTIDIPIDRMREVYAYDPITGTITNKSTGRVIAQHAKNRYSTIALDRGKRRYLAHRVAWAMHYGTQPTELDHINGDPHDNRIANLREVSRQQNMRNRKTAAKSGYKGVTRISPKANENWRKPWIVRMKIMGAQITSGPFETAEEAGLAYEIIAERLYGDFSITRSRAVSRQPS